MFSEETPPGFMNGDSFDRRVVNKARRGEERVDLITHALFRGEAAVQAYKQHSLYSRLGSHPKNQL